MSEITAPPMGGENVPIKELKPEKPAALEFQPQSVKKGKLYILFIILMVIFFGGGIVFGLYIKPTEKQKELAQIVVSPTPSPSLSPLSSSEPKGQEARVLQFEEKLKKADLKEEQLTPPTLDFKIRFKID